MKQFVKGITAVTLGLTTTVALATTPKYLLTHNKTDVQSNAYVAGIIPSPHPTNAHSDGKVSWIAVRIACIGHVKNNRCPAVIKMGTNTKNPVALGTLTMDLTTGDIQPKRLDAHGYLLTVNGSAEATVVKK